MKNSKCAFSLVYLIAACLWVAGCMLPPSVSAWGRGHLYVIGAGPGGPQTATIQAVNTIKRMDVILATQQHVNLFSDYVGQKPVLFDPWKDLWYYKGKSIGQLEGAELADFVKERVRILEQRVTQIKVLLAEGKDVGLMDYGNPCLYSPTHLYTESFDTEDLVVIPGMGCDAAAMAALKRSTIPAHDNYFIIQTAPATLMRWEGRQKEILKDLSKYPSTMVFYSALSLHEELFKDLNATLPPDTPCAVVFWAGYPEKERILRGTVADMSEKLSKEKETFMGLLLVGRFLEGKPRTAVMERAHTRLLEKAIHGDKR